MERRRPRGRKGLEPGGEVAEHGRLLHEPVTGHLRPSLPHAQHALHDVVDVALGVDPARDRETHQLHRRGGLRSGRRVLAPEHHGADLDTADARLENPQRDPGF